MCKNCYDEGNEEFIAALQAAIAAEELAFLDLPHVLVITETDGMHTTNTVVGPYVTPFVAQEASDEFLSVMHRMEGHTNNITVTVYPLHDPSYITIP